MVLEVRIGLSVFGSCGTAMRSTPSPELPTRLVGPEHAATDETVMQSAATALARGSLLINALPFSGGLLRCFPKSAK